MKKSETTEETDGTTRYSGRKYSRFAFPENATAAIKATFTRKTVLIYGSFDRRSS